LALLELVTTLVQTVEIEAYSRFESVARERIDRRDEDDWPILASPLAVIFTIILREISSGGFYRRPRFNAGFKFMVRINLCR
jgi:hypothetical protein